MEGLLHGGAYFRNFTVILDQIMKSRRCTYRRCLCRVKKSALSLVDEMLFLSFELKGKVRKTDKTNIFRPLKQKINNKYWIK